MRISDWSSDVCSSDLYLVYLGVRQIRTDSAPVAVDTGNPAHFSVRELVVRGILVNLMNPKGTVFLLAVVPQFVDPAQTLTPQYAALAGTLVFTDMVAMSVCTLLAAKVLRLLRDARHIRSMTRPEERRVGKACVSTCRYRLSPDP